MSKSGILDALRNEEQSLRSQLVAIQRAIEAIEGNASPVAGRGTKQSRKAVAKPKRAMTEEQRGARSLAVVSLVTPTPTHTGWTDRGRRPRCSIVNREAGLQGMASVRVAVAGRRRRRPVRVCRQWRCTTMS